MGSGRNRSGAEAMLSFRDVAVADLSVDDLARWTQLAEVAIEPNFFLDPRFLHTGALINPDAADIRLVVVEADHRMLGLLAYSVVQPWEALPFRLSTTSGDFLRDHADRHHPLVAPDDPSTTLRMLIEGVQRASRGIVQLRYFPESGPLAEALDAMTSGSSWSRSRVNRFETRFAPPRAVPDRRDAPGSLASIVEGIADISTRRAKQMRRLARNVESVLGSSVPVRVDKASIEQCERFLTFQASGWKGDEQKGGHAFLLDEIDTRWYRALVASLVADGDLYVTTVASSDTTIYMGLTARSGRALFGFIDAYADEFAHLRAGSLGRIVERQTLATAEPELSFDPALPASASDAAGLYPEPRPYSDLWLVRRPMQARLLAFAAPRVVPSAFVIRRSYRAVRSRLGLLRRRLLR